MSTETWRYCPRCATELIDRPDGGLSRRACPAAGCGFIYYSNPLPVGSGIGELDGGEGALGKTAGSISAVVCTSAPDRAPRSRPRGGLLRKLEPPGTPENAGWSARLPWGGSGLHVQPHDRGGGFRGSSQQLEAIH